MIFIFSHLPPSHSIFPLILLSLRLLLYSLSFLSPTFFLTLLFLSYFLYPYYLCCPILWAHWCGKRTPSGHPVIHHQTGAKTPLLFLISQDGFMSADSFILKVIDEIISNQVGLDVQATIPVTASNVCACQRTECRRGVRALTVCGKLTHHC